MINEHSIKANNRKANNFLYLFMATGVIPLLCILVIYYKNPDNPLLHTIATGTENIPSITSSYNPLMTKVMDVYSKSALLLALFAFIFLFKQRKIKKITDREKLITASIFSPFVYAFYVYFFLWNDFELTTAGRTVRWMSENDFTLLIFYICLYYCSFFMTYALCYIPVVSYKLWKER